MDTFSIRAHAFVPKICPGVVSRWRGSLQEVEGGSFMGLKEVPSGGWRRFLQGAEGGPFRGLKEVPSGGWRNIASCFLTQNCIAWVPVRGLKVFPSGGWKSSLRVVEGLPFGWLKGFPSGGWRGFLRVVAIF
jgi:hypothetical protein